MLDELLVILESFDCPVYRQGSMSNDDVYPPTFITLWNSDSPDHAHYDNADYGTAWAYTVNVYSDDPATTYTLLSSIIEALKAAGWVCNGKGYDVASDEASHTGRGVECAYLET